jgi:hypothetical protein
VRRSAWLLGVLLIGLAVPTLPRAAEPPDEGLLEFLGSVDSEDRAWHDYLARTDIDKVAHRTGADPPPRRKPPDPPPSDPPPGSSDKPVTQP